MPLLDRLHRQFVLHLPSVPRRMDLNIFGFNFLLFIGGRVVRPDRQYLNRSLSRRRMSESLMVSAFYRYFNLSTLTGNWSGRTTRPKVAASLHPWLESTGFSACFL